MTAAYTGTSLSNLTSLGCGLSNQGLLTIHANAGTTYYFQVGDFAGGAGSLTFHLIVTPPPTANFGVNPSDPSTFDAVQFFDESFDPGQVGIQAEAWNFGMPPTETTP